MVLNEPCSCACFFLLSEGVFLFEAANVFGKQFFFLTTTITAIVAIAKMNRMTRAAAVIIPASEILSKLIMPPFRIYKPYIRWWLSMTKPYSGGDFTWAWAMITRLRFCETASAFRASKHFRSYNTSSGKLGAISTVRIAIWPVAPLGPFAINYHFKGIIS